MEMTYHAQVSRSGTSWAVYVPEVDRWTQARHLREVDAMVRDLVAVMDDVDVDADSIEIVTEVQTPDEVSQRLRRVGELRAQEARARRDAADELREAARSLRRSGLALRDIGAVLGVSYQRAHQLVEDAQRVA